MAMATAVTNRIRRLFHYQRYDSDRLRQLLESNCVYLSDTKDFNDPWDCRPCFDLSQLDGPVFYERQVRWFEQIGRRQNRGMSDEELRARTEKLRADRPLLEWSIRQMAGIDTEIQKRYRVYCLTTKPADTLMWSHYARNHTGICLEFHCRNDVFSSALQVAYCEGYPLLDLADDSDETVLLPLITKAKVWAYEDEYRLIAQEKSQAFGGASLITNDNFLALPDGALLSVVVGCVAPESTVDAIRSIVQQSGQKVAVRRTVRAQNRYELAVSDWVAECGFRSFSFVR